MSAEAGVLCTYLKFGAYRCNHGTNMRLSGFIDLSNKVMGVYTNHYIIKYK